MGTPSSSRPQLPVTTSPTPSTASGRRPPAPSHAAAVSPPSTVTASPAATSSATSASSSTETHATCTLASTASHSTALANFSTDSANKQPEPLVYINHCPLYCNLTLTGANRLHQLRLLTMT